MSKRNDRKPLLARVGNWGVSRIRKPELIERSANNVRGATNSALDAVRPAEFDKEDFFAGYRGRHADGGKARFNEMVETRGLAGTQLNMIRAQHLRLALIFVAAAAAALFYGLYMMFTAGELLGIFGGAAVSALFFAFMALSLRHDFAAWQLKVRRFGGFSEYLATRL